MATRKRKFWNEGGIPELGENPPPKSPQRPIESVTVGPSTGTHVPPPSEKLHAPEHEQHKGSDDGQADDESPGRREP